MENGNDNYIVIAVIQYSIFKVHLIYLLYVVSLFNTTVIIHKYLKCFYTICTKGLNLEANLTNEELSHTIVSTYEYYEYKVLMEPPIIEHGLNEQELG